MFRAPRTPEQVFVKRIVAQAGDVVRILDGRVFVNDRELDDAQVPADFRSHEDWGPYRVPHDFYLVLGDHRNRSSDSRHWGPVGARSDHRQGPRALVAARERVACL